MDRYSIRNRYLEVHFKRKGAELCSVTDDSGVEFIWQAGEAWPRHAPNLFPIVGSLIDHEYSYNGEFIALRHHGFARDLDFDVLHQSEHSICFVLESSSETLSMYPFDFTLLITYTLTERSLRQQFRVMNRSDRDMPVSFGGHPAFNASPVQDFYIEFSEPEQEWCNLLKGPYIDDAVRSVISQRKIELDEHTFDDDALVFLQVRSRYVSLRHRYSNYQVRVDRSEFPYLGIWAKPGAPFVCIEPWQGLADIVGHDKDITRKEGIVWLSPDSETEKGFTMEFLP